MGATMTCLSNREALICTDEKIFRYQLPRSGKSSKITMIEFDSTRLRQHVDLMTRWFVEPLGSTTFAHLLVASGQVYLLGGAQLTAEKWMRRLEISYDRFMSPSSFSYDLIVDPMKIPSVHRHSRRSPLLMTLSKLCSLLLQALRTPQKILHVSHLLLHLHLCFINASLFLIDIRYWKSGFPSTDPIFLHHQLLLHGSNLYAWTTDKVVWKFADHNLAFCVYLL